MTNGEWLDYLAHNAPDELAAWFDAEHVETEERALDGDTAAQDGDSRDKLEADVRKIADAYNMDTQRHGTERFAHELYYSIIHLLNRQRAIDDSICDECSSDFYKLQEAYDALEDEVDKLTAERDEWKAKAEKLANDTLPDENGVSDPYGGSNVAYIAPDSREKLEADIWYFIEHNGWFGYEYEAESYADCRKAIFEIFKEWLDRQAAITEREHPGLTVSDDESLINWRGRNYLPQSRVLNAERERDEFSLKLKHEMELNRDNRNAHDLERIDELTAERDEWKAKAGEIQQMLDWEEWPDGGEINLERAWVNHMRTIEQLQGRVKELTTERDELKERADYNSHGWAKANIGWAEANAEAEKWRMKCDHYRSKFGKSLDYADAIHALMDDEGMA